MDPELARRAQTHAALGEPVRLAIVDDLTRSDRSPKELGQRHGLPTNLLAHHLAVLEDAGLIERFVSSGDRRRRYVRLDHHTLATLSLAPTPAPGTVLFICSHNSARAQLAAALYTASTGEDASSAGTHPAQRVHPGAVAAAHRAGLDLHHARPRLLDPDETADSVVTVCDRAHEELPLGAGWLHWSIPDPVAIGTDAAFDAVVDHLRARIATLN